MLSNNFSTTCRGQKLLEDKILQNLTILESNSRRTHTYCKSNNMLNTKTSNTVPFIDMREDFNLINLGNDVCATPRHATGIDTQKQTTHRKINKLHNNSNVDTKTESLITLTPELDTQFGKFLDKYDPKSHMSLYRTELGKEACSSNQENIIHDDIGNVKILIPKLKVLDIDEDLKFDEDLIEEVLLEKNIEKQSRSPINTHNIEGIGIDKLCHLNYHDGNKSNTDEDSMDKIISMSHIDTTVPRLNVKVFHAPLSETANNACVSQKNNLFKSNKDDDQRSYPHAKINQLVTAHDIRYLEAIKTDEKTFQKRSLLKTESEKLHLTPGPNLYEKSVVLPTIMQRLTARKQAIEKFTNMRRKLILEAGSYVDPAQKKNNNVESAEVTIDSKTSNLERAPVNYISGSKHIRISEKSDSAHKMTFEDLSVEKLRVLRRELYEAEMVPSNANIDRHINSDNAAAFRPQTLTNNCNRNRFLDYATSRLLDDFVRSGK